MFSSNNRCRLQETTDKMSCGSITMYNLIISISLSGTTSMVRFGFVCWHQLIVTCFRAQLKHLNLYELIECCFSSDNSGHCCHQKIISKCRHLPLLGVKPCRTDACCIFHYSVTHYIRALIITSVNIFIKPTTLCSTCRWMINSETSYTLCGQLKLVTWLHDIL